MTTTIYHNPACGTSRNVPAMMRASGTEPVIVEYFRTAPSRTEVSDLVRRTGISLRDVVRRQGTPFDALGLGDPGVSEEGLRDVIAAHPILLNRPIVATPKGVRLCRPSGIALALPERMLPADFTREDGTPVAGQGPADRALAA